MSHFLKSLGRKLRTKGAQRHLNYTAPFFAFITGFVYLTSNTTNSYRYEFKQVRTLTKTDEEELVKAGKTVETGKSLEEHYENYMNNQFQERDGFENIRIPRDEFIDLKAPEFPKIKK